MVDCLASNRTPVLSTIEAEAQARTDEGGSDTE